MKQERMKILSMVEDGKISVEEATKLLDVIASSTTENDYDSSSEIQEKFNQFSANMDHFAKELTSKISLAYKDMEPKVKSATRSIVEKTATIVDDISKSIHESLENMSQDENRCDCGTKENLNADGSCDCGSEENLNADGSCDCGNGEAPKNN